MKTFDEVWETLPEGWLSRAEAKLLWTVAAQYSGPILEVGCYRGRSTVLLAALGRPLYCVDPFSNFHSDDPSGDKIFASWVETVSNLDEAMNILWFRQKIEDWTPVPGIGFAYLDGDHTYEGTKAQIEVAKACGAVGIGVHDVNDRGGGVEVKRACLELLGPWKVRVERLAVWGTI